MRIILLFCLFTALVAIPAAGQQIQYEGSALWTSVHDIKVAGTLAYCAFSSGLTIIDISDASRPAFISQLFLPGSISLEVFYPYVHLSRGWHGIDIINISNPYQPVLITNIPINGFVWDIAIRGDYAYVVGNDSCGLRIVDISNPQTPVISATHLLGGTAYSIAFYGDHAFIANDTNGVQILDIENPHSPVYVGLLDILGAIYDLAVKGHYLYVANYNLGLYIFDIITPQAPQSIGINTTARYGAAIAINDSLLYLNRYFDIDIIYISYPEFPLEVGSYNHGGTALNITFADGLLFIPKISGSGIEIVNANNPILPFLVGYYSTPSFVSGIIAENNYAYLITADSGLVIYDASVPLQPIRTGYCNPTGQEVSMVIDGNYAYLAESVYGVSIVDILNPSNPTIVGSCVAQGDVRDILVQGNYAYTAARINGMGVIDISDRANPHVVGTWYIAYSDARGIIVHGQYAYLADYHWGLIILDVANPTMPQEVTRIFDSIPAYNVFVDNNCAYLAKGDSGIFIYDITEPGAPIPTGRYQTIGSAYNLKVIGSYAYIVDRFYRGNGGIEVVNVQNPANPTLVSHFYSEQALNISLSGNKIFIANGYSVIILRFNSSEIEEFAIIPNTFSLSPNYPNPFNSATTIRYNLPTESSVMIDIYDILGRKVQTLLAVKEQAGVHQVNWNAADLPSGAYFARLKAGEQTKSMKMMLMK
jgi:hypothetical protein